jgi:histone deacetylase complex regulatory component SIN3
MEPKNYSFEQPEGVQNSSAEKAESITSEASSHKMRIDELTGGEDNHSMEIDNTSLKQAASSSGSISKIILFKFIKLTFLFYILDVKVSNISSVINETPKLTAEDVESQEATNVLSPAGSASTAIPLTSNTPTSTTSNVISTGSTSTTQSMQLNDAFAYLDRVRAEFADQPEIYNKFLQVMREFKSNR